MPVGTLGPRADHGPLPYRVGRLLGVPWRSIVRVIVDTAQYDSILKDLYTRIGYKPLADSNPIEQIPAAPAW